jgi:hypothetical protein
MKTTRELQNALDQIRLVKRLVDASGLRLGLLQILNLTSIESSRIVGSATAMPADLRLHPFSLPL